MVFVRNERLMWKTGIVQDVRNGHLVVKLGDDQVSAQ